MVSVMQEPSNKTSLRLFLLLLLHLYCRFLIWPEEGRGSYKETFAYCEGWSFESPFRGHIILSPCQDNSVNCTKHEYTKSTSFRSRFKRVCFIWSQATLIESCCRICMDASHFRFGTLTSSKTVTK